MDENRINIFIPAAGKGERLRPITNHIPKPLMPLLGKPVLQRVIERVSSLSVEGIGLNVYYMKEKISGWVERSLFRDDITIFEEDALIGTGGALKNAEGFLRGSTFLVHNSDVISDIDLEKLLAHHRSSGNLVTLAVHDHPKFNNVLVDEKGLVLDVVGAGFMPALLDAQALAFTGIAVYEPEFLKFLPDGVSSVVDAWLKAVGAGERIGTFDVTGCCWSDIGTPQSYASAVFAMLRQDGETVYVHPSVKKCGDIDMQGYVVIEDGCDLRGIETLSNCIMGFGFRVLLDEADIFDLDEDGNQLIGTGGSDRKYYRIRSGEGTSVLMQCGADDLEFERHLEYTRFFIRQGVPVPELISAETEKMRAVFEDAGDISLYSRLKCPRPGEAVEEIYKKAIDALIKIHSIREGDLSECLLLKERVFDRDYFRWETVYFIERFVKGLWGIDPDNSTGLVNELDTLAAEADSFPKTVVHRDLQSQNIMVKKDKLYLIDFQGARIGPPAYDIASLLWDPYRPLEAEVRERLLGYYMGRMAAVTNDFDEAVFRDSLGVCRLQRHMQALGAYGYLSGVKGKKYFLKYVPEGLRLLKEDIEVIEDNYPELKRFIIKL